MELIPAQYYHDIYLIIILLLSSISFSKYGVMVGNGYRRYDKSQSALGWLICLFMILFIGTRPISDVFADMPQYYGIYQRWSGQYEFIYDTDNIIYDNLMSYLASIRFEPILFYILIAAIYFGCMWLACSRLFPRDKVAAYLVCLAAFSTFSYGTNGIKAGSAAAVFMLALSYRNNLKLCIPLVIASFGFHHAMQLPIAAFICTLFYRKPKYFLYFWVLCLFMAIAHVTYFQFLFGGMTDDQGAGYLNNNDNTGGKGGLRIDFIIYSAMPVLMSWYSSRKMQIKSLFYDTLTCIYLFTNGIWLLCMYAHFTNRIAYLSWSIYPIVLIYPILNEQWKGNRYRFFAKVAWAHLTFTLFMNFVYYA